MSDINLPAILAANGLGAWLMAVVLRAERHNTYDTSFGHTAFLCMCRLNFLLCLLETASFLADGQSFWGASLLLRLINTLLFLLDISFACLWAFYADYKIFEDLPGLRRRAKWLIFPALCTAVLCLLNLRFDLFFTLSADNTYSRRMPVVFLYLITYLYLMYGALLPRFCKRRNRHTLFFPVGTFLAPVFIGSILQFHFYGIAMIWPAVAVGLVALHTNLQTEEASLDPLTGLFNRNYLLQYLNHSARQLEQGHRLTGLLLDMDNFKQINDMHGHSEGDKVLRTMGQLLLQSIPPQAIAVRYGGDEFVVLMMDTTPSQQDTLRQTLQQKLDEYNASHGLPYRIDYSYGFAETTDTRFDVFFREMDRSMYLDKQQSHAVDENASLLG